jgi:hypothetical protein
MVVTRLNLREHENNTGKHPNQQVNAVGLALCVYYSLE